MKRVLQRAIELGVGFGKALDANSSILMGAKRVVNKNVDLAVAAKNGKDLETAKDLTKKQIKSIKKAVGITEDVENGESLYNLIKDNETYSNKLNEIINNGEGADKRIKQISDLRNKNFNGKLDELEKMGYSTKDVLKNAVKDYYSLENEGKIIAARYGATAGAYMGANMLMRSATGGSLYRNNKGEADIAGIPFI